MEKITLKAKTRDKLGKKVKEVRAEGFVPAVLYGKDKKPHNVQVNLDDFNVAYEKAGTSALIDLVIDDKDAGKVLVQDVQYDPVKDHPIHADFYAIKMDEEITTEIPLKFVGVSPAVKDMEGSFISNYDEIEVECLPANLIPEIVVDISGLKTFDDNIRIADLDIPSTIKVLDDAEQVVALVNAPRSEEELEAMEAESASDAEKAGVEKIETDAEKEKAAKEAEKAAEEGEEGVKKPEAKTETKTEEKK